ncbi:glycoside hydrolase family 53 protein [Robertkochia sediminum]|uniref:glycoside hydrolase family 53 protein n=1 Tax=Robertkochia sediminum TaxID=2785326 RepID=UPI001933701D|nr:glycosyl hydrolase 53 family protein [Robertkochia sediminum]MBL7472865.1 glycosyl hydrolase 53 family protein [Robertkochia sediminum]
MHKHYVTILICSLLILSSSCANKKKPTVLLSAIETTANRETVRSTPVNEFYYGADLSYVNEMEDCDAKYYDETNTEKDPYEIFSNAGANLVRLRLWHNPEWTDYSTLEDVKRSIKRAKEHHMKVLLDFHYSDDWADPSKQEIPAAWSNQINDTQTLGYLLYDYTSTTLRELYQEGLLPDMVQVGNEINSMILRKGPRADSINWVRNAYLINKGIDAVRDVSEEVRKDIDVMLHIAQPENALTWFREAKANKVTDFDWIGLSYYPKWSTYGLDSLQPALETLIGDHSKKLMIVETAYPYTLSDNDSANNLLDESALIEGYPATQQGQLDYLIALKDIVKDAGGSGIIYWEPAWTSTSCKTRWGQGSHWDNATLFDANGKATLGMNFYYNALTGE